ncbi:MAG: FlgD immunoglobulin-like domain containing protein [bacterium]
MKRAAALLVVLAATSAARADVTFQMLGFGGATDVSADGTVIVGNSEGTYETWRWTQATGQVLLGRSSVQVLGIGAGTPGVSADGTRVSATILGADSTYATQGLWTEGSGWQETMPPVPPDGGLMDGSYASAWGLSGDGHTVVGLYWRPGQPGGSAHACRWTQVGGVADLGSGGGNSRANAVSYDGTVIAGWDEHTDGHWQPTVWENGAKHILSLNDVFCEADAVNEDGTVITGQSYDAGSDLFVAAVWRKSGATWTEQLLGALPGTFPIYGYVTALGVSADGKLIVGYNAFSGQNATGFLWTAATGMVDVVTFLTQRGVTLPSRFDVLSLTGVSDDGKTIVGFGQDTTAPFHTRSFVIRLSEPVGAPILAETPASTPVLRIFPNPARQATAMALDLPRAGAARLEIFDVAGRLVRRLVDDELANGRREVRWDGRDASGAAVASGVYEVRLSAGTVHETKKLIFYR